MVILTHVAPTDPAEVEVPSAYKKYVVPAPVFPPVTLATEPLVIE